MTDKSRRVHAIRLFVICLLAMGMPNLNLLMSIGTILLFILWFIDPGIKKGLSRLTLKNPATWMAGLFILHIVWLVNTSDWTYAMKDLRIKLPLLVLALALGTLKLSRDDLKKVFVALGIGIWIATLIGYYLYFSDPMVKMDPRSMTHDISHIRLSLMITVFIAACFAFFREIGSFWKVFAILSLLNAFIFLYFLQTLTAPIVLVVGSAVLVVKYLFEKSGSVIRMALLMGVVLIPVVLFFAMKNFYSEYYEPQEDSLPLLSSTADGNYYYHYDTLQIENGNYIYANVATDELIKAWNKRGTEKIVLDSDSELYYRVLRYMTSKGLAKDRVGVESLSDDDISNIEAGFPSVAYVEKSGLELRLHTFLHGTHLYLTTGTTQGSSFYQRFIYWEIGMGLAMENILTGVGTGDIKESFKVAYENYPVFIEPKYRHRAHNQYITFLATFGILGFCYFLGFVLFLLERWSHRNLFLFFALAAVVSFLSEDTLETQAGVTFFSFFVGLFSAVSAED